MTFEQTPRRAPHRTPPHLKEMIVDYGMHVAISLCLGLLSMRMVNDCEKLCCVIKLQCLAFSWMLRLVASSVPARRLDDRAATAVGPIVP